MKNCEYCGCENADEAARCRQCEMVFDSDTKEQETQEERFSEWFRQPVSSRLKAWFWYGAWGVVILISLALNPSYILAAPCFPLGLLALFPRGEESAIAAWMLGVPSIIIGWTFYILLSVVISRTKKKGAFFLTYIVFCIVLALNIAGCQKTIESVAGIQ